MAWFEGLFVLGFLLAAAWVASLIRFVRLMRERHPGKHAEMHLEGLFPEKLAAGRRRAGDPRAAADLLRFLWRREYEQLRDDKLEQLALMMRGLLFCLVVVFAVAFFQMFSTLLAPGNNAAAARDASPREKAFALHRQGRYAEAGRIYDQLVDKDGDNDILFWRGVARRYEQRPEDALADLRRVMEVDPRKYEAYLHADRILAEHKRFEECLDLWNQFLEVVPAHKDAFFERSRAHFHLRNLAAALADAQRACELGRPDACPVARDLRAKMDDATKKAAP